MAYDRAMFPQDSGLSSPPNYNSTTPQRSKSSTPQRSSVTPERRVQFDSFSKSSNNPSSEDDDIQCVYDSTKVGNVNLLLSKLDKMNIKLFDINPPTDSKNNIETNVDVFLDEFQAATTALPGVTKIALLPKYCCGLGLEIVNSVLKDFRERYPVQKERNTKYNEIINDIRILGRQYVSPEQSKRDLYNLQLKPNETFLSFYFSVQKTGSKICCTSDSSKKDLDKEMVDVFLCGISQSLLRFMKNPPTQFIHILDHKHLTIIDMMIVRCL